MKTASLIFSCAVALAVAFSIFASAAREPGPLASWNDTETKAAIIAFVELVTNESGDGFVPEPERIAVFDNDGTLWCEHPLYVQLVFALDRVKALAPEHPEWTTTHPFKAVLEDDLDALAETGMEGIIKILAATHAGMTTTEFEQIASDWIAQSEHPRFNRKYTELVYQPMLELLDYLRDNGFKTFIVSGGGVEFMRPWTENVYGIPPEQIVGSRIKTVYEVRNGKGVLVRKPEIAFIDDKEGKPVGIIEHIGRRPILAFGNSDGDRQMLEWTTEGNGPRFAAIVHHTDAEREYAYDTDTHVGRFTAEFMESATAAGFTIVDMKNDWSAVFRD